MRKLGWILSIAWWLYFITASFLYVRFRFEWVNTVNVLLTFAVLVAFSVWYVIQNFRSDPGKSRWALGRNGGLYRIKSQECSTKQPK